MTYPGEHHADALPIPAEPSHDIRAELTRYVTKLGLTPDEAAVLLRDDAANERIRATHNLEIIARRGNTERRMDLRLVPQEANLTLSLSTARNEADASTYTAEEDITVVRGAAGWIQLERSRREYRLRTRRKQLRPEHTNLHTTQTSQDMFVSGIEYEAGRGSDDRRYLITPHIRFDGEVMLVLPSEDTEWGGYTISSSIYGSAGLFTTKLKAATIQYMDELPLIAFGTPHDISGRIRQG